MKKVKFLVIVFMMLFFMGISGVSADTYDFTTNISVDEDTLYAGNEVYFDISIENLASGTKLAAGTYNLTFNSDIYEYVEDSAISLQGTNGMVLSNLVSGDIDTLILAFANTDGYTNGKILRVYFNIKNDVSAGDGADISLIPEENSFGDADLSDLTTNSINASYKIVEKTVNVDDDKSNDATLSSIKINGESIELKPGQYEYTIPDVDYKYSYLNISYTASNNNAKVSVSGNNLSVGSNSVYLTVTAEDGTTKTYTINVVRLEENVLTGIGFPISIVVLAIVGFVMFILIRKKSYFSRI